MTLTYIALGVGAIFIIALFVVTTKYSDNAWDEANNAPKFIIKPSYDLGYDIWEKDLLPLPGRAPLVNYRPLYGHYKTREEAEKQLAHYNEYSDA